MKTKRTTVQFWLEVWLSMLTASLLTLAILGRLSG